MRAELELQAFETRATLHAEFELTWASTPFLLASRRAVSFHSNCCTHAMQRPLVSAQVVSIGPEICARSPRKGIEVIAETPQLLQTRGKGNGFAPATDFCTALQLLHRQLSTAAPSAIGVWASRVSVLVVRK